jgi:phosphate acyltransferase
MQEGTMRIFVDAMGGDLAPQAPVEGAVEALRRNAELTVTLAGVVSEIEKYLTDAADVRDRITLLDAPEVITNHESPVMGVRKKTKSATVMGMLVLRNHEVDGFVSAGSTGAVLAGAMFRLGRIPGVERPALAPMLPNGKGYFLLIDCGANVDCKPDYLAQFGVMGDAYMRGVMGIEKPRVGIINIGAEDEKGNELVKESFPLMKQAPYHFIGSVEARDLFSDIADVCVADGFAGNLVLKTTEGVALFMMKQMKQQLMADTRSKIGAMIAKPALRRLKHTLDYTEVGGAPLLGVQGAVVKAHGSSNAHAFSCAIDQVIKMINGHVVEIIEQGVSAMTKNEGD